MTRDEYVQFLKTTALDIGKRTVFKALASQVPFFAAGPMAYIAQLIIGKVLEVAITQSEMGAFFLYVDLRVDKQGANFEEAARNWFMASPEEKSKFEGAYLNAFYKVASLKS